MNERCATWNEQRSAAFLLTSLASVKISSLLANVYVLVSVASAIFRADDKLRGLASGENASLDAAKARAETAMVNFMVNV